MKLPLLFLLLTATAALAADQPQWGRAWGRNFTSDEKGLPETFDVATGKNVLWTADLGTESYSTPVIADGRVYIGTNNLNPRDEKRPGDAGTLMCFSEKDGKFLWQLVIPKRWEDQYLDWPKTGLCSSATVDGERVYIVSNRGEVLCLDAHGMANGNDGPFKDEAALAAPPRRDGQEAVKAEDGATLPDTLKLRPSTAETTPTDADVIWRIDLTEDAGIWPHDGAHSAIMVLGDHLYLNTGTGVDYTHRRIRTPHAPSLIVLEKSTGRILARDAVAEGIAPNIFHNTWAGPSLGEINGQKIVFFCAGNGIVYGFEPLTSTPPAGTVLDLKKIFQFDPDPAAPKTEVHRFTTNRREGPVNFYGMPVFVDGRLYIAGGGDVFWGKNDAWMKCLAFPDGAAKPSLVWTHPLDKHTLSTPVIADGLAYATDSEGGLHCVDAATGVQVWRQQLNGSFWASPFVADGKVYVGTRRGQFTAMATGREQKILAQFELSKAAINATVTAANGVLYVATMTKLYAIKAQP